VEFIGVMIAIEIANMKGLVFTLRLTTPWRCGFSSSVEFYFYLIKLTDLVVLKYFIDGL
jgi:hypothetical protein